MSVETPKRTGRIHTVYTTYYICIRIITHVYASDGPKWRCVTAGHVPYNTMIT